MINALGTLPRALILMYLFLDELATDPLTGNLIQRISSGIFFFRKSHLEIDELLMKLMFHGHGFEFIDDGDEVAASSE